jgi:membrane associated rhomboid family serine protease
MTFLQEIKGKSREIAILHAVILIPMWSMFLLNNLLLGEALSGWGGIHPRDFSLTGWSGIFTSWMFHGSGTGGGIRGGLWAHILGNSEILLPLIFIIGIFEKKPLRLVFSLIVVSGFFTWLLGAAHSVHIGASGLVFSMFGYILSSIFLARRWRYLIPVIAWGGAYFYSMRAGLIPEPGISFAAHFGGLIGGILVAWFIGKTRVSEGK